MKAPLSILDRNKSSGYFLRQANHWDTGMLTKATVDVVEFIGSTEGGVSRPSIRAKFPDLSSTLINRLKLTGLLAEKIPIGASKRDGRISLTEEGSDRLKFFQENPGAVSRPRKAYVRAEAKPPVKIPSHMDDEMRQHLENEARIGQQNELINGVLKTVYATIISGLEGVPETAASMHPMEKRNQLLRNKLVSLKEHMEQ